METTKLANSMKTGLKNGVETTIMLSKVLIPVYFVVTFLKHTPILDGLAMIFQPLMKMFGLPGEAAIVLVLGNTINLYAAIGMMKAISLDAYQITTLALMLSFSHSLIVETAVVKKTGAKGYVTIGTRIMLALAAGLLMGIFKGGI